MAHNSINDVISAMKKMRNEKIIQAKDFRRCIEIAKAERRDGMLSGIDANGNPMTPLKPETIKAKRRKGYVLPETPLVAKGFLANPMVEEGDDYASIKMPNSRTKIAEYHQKGMGNNPERLHVGFYPKAIAKINQYISNTFVKRLRELLRG